jgi:hypothetical protein
VKPFELQSAGGADSVIWDGTGSSTDLVITAANGWIILKSLGDRWIVVGMDLDAN